jgi:hypothetical protein
MGGPMLADGSRKAIDCTSDMPLSGNPALLIPHKSVLIKRRDLEFSVSERSRRNNPLSLEGIHECDLAAPADFPEATGVINPLERSWR